MKRTSVTLFSAILLLVAIGCSNWNKVTPKPLDNSTIEAEVRKNLTAEGITGIGVDVDSGQGRVTLSGSVRNNDDRRKAENAASKVDGVRSVINNITIQP